MKIYEILDTCPKCLTDHNEGTKLFTINWTCNDLENNVKECPKCGFRITIEKGEKK